MGLDKSVKAERELDSKQAPPLLIKGHPDGREELKAWILRYFPAEAFDVDESLKFLTDAGLLS